jgi:acyl-CoA synthetase (NDP forming)/GNAT superfamily N-acetyltransferase
MTDQPSATSGTGPVFALLADGATAEIRTAAPEDREAVRALHAAMSPENLYLRVFGTARDAPERLAARICRTPGTGHLALLARHDGELVGVAEYERTERPGVAEIAFAVADRAHHRGVATLLLEHLAEAARDRGLTEFTATTLAVNAPMLRVFADAGLPVRYVRHEDEIGVRLLLGTGAHYLDAVAARERAADVASLRPLLRPRAVAVVGAGRAGGVGHAILANLADGYAGRLYAVNPHATRIGDVPCVPRIADLPEAVELAVLAVPPASVVAAATACGDRGVRALAVITAGLSADQGTALMDVARHHDMRVAGPNCLGVANTAAGVTMNASFAARAPRPGGVGVVAQSGGVAIALSERLSRLGAGISTCVTVGDKYDVSGNDMLSWWADDGVTRAGVIYLESFGNPRKFARTARRVARTIPLFALLNGRSIAGGRAAASHTAAAATPAVTQTALFEQAGVTPVGDVGELMAAIALITRQPPPAGRRVAVISNAGGAGVLAADACADEGLSVPELSPDLRERLEKLLPDGAACANPIDATAAVDAARFRTGVQTLLASGEVDAVIALPVPTALGDPGSGLALSAGPRPVAVVELRQIEDVRLHGDIAKFTTAHAAARALHHAARRSAWLTRDPGHAPEVDGVDPDLARALVTRFLTDTPTGGWLPPALVTSLLRAYGFPLVDTRMAATEAQARHIARELGPAGVALKAYVPGLLHKSAAHAVHLNRRGDLDVSAAYRDLSDRFGASLAGVVVQPMSPPGLELFTGLIHDPTFGPLVAFGLGGTTTDLIADRAIRLAPLTTTDAADLIAGTRAARMLGTRQPLVEDLLHRVSRLSDDVPEIAELDLNPCVLTDTGIAIPDARIRVAPTTPAHPHLRELRRRPA